MNHQEHNDHKDRKHHEPVPDETERVVREIIGAAIEVHRQLGPGFIETVYRKALRIELRHRNLLAEAERSIQVHYRGELVCRHRLDIVVERAVVVEVKAVRKIRPIHHAQVLSYLKASRCRVGLLMNFNVSLFVDGLRRFVL